MDWLAICRRVAKEIGFAGDDETPATMAGQTGEMLSVINWTADSWLAVQGSTCWDWQWENPEIVIQSGTYFTAATVPAHRYRKDGTWAGTRQLGYVAWDDFRLAWPAARIVEGSPSVWTIRPDHSIAVNAKPTADLTLTVERYANPTELADYDDNDTPPMPAERHMAIVWKAVMLYAGNDEAGETYQHAKNEFRRVMGEMAIDEQPEIEFGPPLA